MEEYATCKFDQKDGKVVSNFDEGEAELSELADDRKADCRQWVWHRTFKQMKRLGGKE